MRDAHTLHMRFGLVLLLAAAVFAVVPSASLAIRFADTPCVEIWDFSRLPGRRRRKPVCNSAQRRRRVRSRPSVSVQSAEQVPATRPRTRQGRTAPRHTRYGGHLDLLGRAERRGPTVGRWCRPVKSEREFIVTVAAQPATVGSAYAVQVSAAGVGALAWSVASGTLPPGLAFESNHGFDLGHACGHRHVRVQALGDRHSRRNGRRGSHDRGVSEAGARDDTTGPRRVGRSYRAVVRASGTVQPVTFTVRAGRVPGRDASQHEDWGAEWQAA